jgi:hypothetical protein
MKPFIFHVTIFSSNKHLMENTEIKQLKVKRPRNAFIIYRQEKSANVDYECISIFNVSKIIGQQWKNESEQVKQFYRLKAKIESDELKIRLPDHVFRRRNSSTISRRIKGLKTIEKRRLETKKLVTLQSFKFILESSLLLF